MFTLNSVSKLFFGSNALDPSLGRVSRKTNSKFENQMQSLLFVLASWNKVSHSFYLAVSTQDTNLCEFWMYTLRHYPISVGRWYQINLFVDVHLLI